MSSIITYTHTHSTHTHSIFKIENQQTSCAPHIHIHLHQHTHTYIHTLYTSHTYKETYNKYLNMSFFCFPSLFCNENPPQTHQHTRPHHAPHTCPLWMQSDTHTHTHTPHTSVCIYILYIRTDTLKTLIKQHYDRINKLEDQKYDLEYVVKRKDVEVHTQNYQSIYLSRILLQSKLPFSI